MRNSGAEKGNWEIWERVYIMNLFGLSYSVRLTYSLDA